MDIYAEDVKGLGRGKGFAAVGKHSILGSSELTTTIKARLLDLLEMLYANGLLAEAELTGRFEMLKAGEDELGVLRAAIEVKDRRIRELTDEVDATKAGREEVDERIESMIGRVSEELGEVVMGEPIEVLSALIDILIEEFGAVKARAEELDDRKSR